MVDVRVRFLCTYSQDERKNVRIGRLNLYIEKIGARPSIEHLLNEEKLKRVLPT